MSIGNRVITKYYFGYFMYHGHKIHTAWREENGLSLLAYVQRHEITEREWEADTLAALAIKYPPEPG